MSTYTTMETLLTPTTLARVEHIAREAGRRVRAHFQAAFNVWEKAPGDLLTDADVAAHRYIVQALADAFPHVQVWSEEGEAPAHPERPLWLVDPVDGTTNFAHRFPVFVVSLALWWEGRPVLGVVYDPLRDQLFSALRGHGAFLNGERRLSVTATRHLDQALVACDWTRGPGRPHLLAAVNALGLEVQALRCLGAAALGLAYVAAGWLDAYFNAQLQPWDFAAGVVLVEEAGGLTSDWQGAPLPLGTTTVLAATPPLYPVVQSRLSMCSTCK